MNSLHACSEFNQRLDVRKKLLKNLSKELLYEFGNSENERIIC